MLSLTSKIPAVVVVLACGDSRFLSDVRKRAVAVVSIQGIAQWLRRREKVRLAAINQVDITPTVIVVVQKRATQSSLFR
jgi:hypothetical protein